METEKALIYCRVSSQKQVVEGTGLDSQERLCRDYTDNKRYKVEKTFKEEGISGGLFERPAMRSLIKYLDDHPLEKYVVVFDDLKRFARDVNVHLQLKAQLLSRGVRLECPNFRFEDSPEGRLFENVTAATAQYERESNRRQVIQKMRARLSNGYWAFRSPPRGIKYIKDKLHGKLLVSDEPFATIYKEAIERYSRNELNTLLEVQQFICLEYKRQRLDKPISISGTQNILTELLYTGYMEYPKWDIPFQKGKHEGFISLETYKTVQDKLAGKSYKTLRKDYSIDFPLRTFVLCSTCGEPLTAAWTKGRNPNLKFPYYWCRNRECLSRYKIIQRDKLETSFIELLGKEAVDQEKADLLNIVLQRTWKEEQENELVSKLSTSSKKKSLEDNIDNLSIRISTTKDIDLLGVYEKRLKGLIVERKSLDVVTEKKYSEEEFQTASNLVFSTLKKPVETFQNKNYQLKSTIIKMYFPNRLSYDRMLGFQTADLEPTIKLINNYEPTKNPLVEMPGIEPGSEETRLQRFSEG